MKSCSGRKCNTLVPYVEGKTYNAKLMHGGARYAPILMNRACVGSSSLPCRSDTSTTLSTTESTQRAEMRTDMKRVALKQNRLRHNPSSHPYDRPSSSPNPERLEWRSERYHTGPSSPLNPLDALEAS